jgi:MoaA/NifB/PqqE/SkfB family radical SAM enzyme
MKEKPIVKETVGNELVLDDTKLMWHQERVKAWLAGERIAPITIDCALTRACTYRCTYCYSRLQNNPEKPMTRDVIFQFLDDAAFIGVKAVSFVSDGESTCSPHFYDAVTHGKANGLDMAIGTSGVLLKPEKLPQLLKALTYLRFNISAGEAQRYAQIHGCKESDFHTVCTIITECVRIKKELGLAVTLGLQMVFLPEFSDQVIPLANLGKKLGADYLVIKHCSDDEVGSLNVPYEKYEQCYDLLKKAEILSDEHYLVKVKWSKIASGKKRIYDRCYGPAFIMQFSGSGLVAPCGMLFNEKYKRFHIGNIADMSFRDLWKSERYWEVIDYLASDKFNAQHDCGYLCLQHKANEYLWLLKNNKITLAPPAGPMPQHVNFI